MIWKMGSSVPIPRKSGGRCPPMWNFARRHSAGRFSCLIFDPETSLPQEFGNASFPVIAKKQLLPYSDHLLSIGGLGFNRAVRRPFCGILFPVGSLAYPSLKSPQIPHCGFTGAQGTIGTQKSRVTFLRPLRHFRHCRIKAYLHGAFSVGLAAFEGQSQFCQCCLPDIHLLLQSLGRC